MASKAKKKVAKRKKKMAESAPVVKQVAKCPMCLTEYPDCPLTEPVYECTSCGRNGFDCCVAGTGVKCSSCEDEEDEEYDDGWAEYDEEEEEGMID